MTWRPRSPQRARSTPSTAVRSRAATSGRTFVTREAVLKAMTLPYERRLSSMRPEGPVSYQGYWNDFVRFLNETVDGDDVYVAVPLKRRGADGASRVANLIRTTLRRRGVEGWRVMTDPDGTGIWVHRSGPPGPASADEGSSAGPGSCGPALRAAVEPRGWRLDEPSCLHDESCPSFRRNGHRYV